MPTSPFAYGAYIGRFEPPHKAHLAVMREALSQVDVLIVVLGSAGSPRSVKNPWTADEREAMIAGMLAEAGIAAARVRFARVRDFFYDEARWLAEVRRVVTEQIGAAQTGAAHTGTAQTGASQRVALIGHIKDDSSYYLRSFPEWPYLPTHVESPLNATDIRKLYFGGREFVAQEYVPPAVARFLQAFRETPDFANLQSEHAWSERERARWARMPDAAARVTAHAAVRAHGHVLLIRRGAVPGKGLLALPGGELGERQRLLTACLETLRAQTGLDETVNLGAPRASAVFDFPDRSSPSRAVAQAFAFNLGAKPPFLRMSSSALWLPLADALGRPELFFEDHRAMLEHFFEGDPLLQGDNVAG